MKEFEKLIEFGRKVKAYGGSHRGAVIQLSGKTAYLTNLKRSALYRITYNTPIGDGVFYAGEAPLFAEEIRDRGEKVLFTWHEKGMSKNVLTPKRDDIKKESDKAFKSHYMEPDIKLPDSIWDCIDPNMLMVTLTVEGDKLRISQKQSDGSVQLETELKLGTGLIEVDYPKASITFFTSDLLVLKGYVTNLKLGIPGDNKPISLSGKFDGNKFEALISYLLFDEEEGGD